MNKEFQSFKFIQIYKSLITQFEQNISAIIINTNDIIRSLLKNLNHCAQSQQL